MKSKSEANEILRRLPDTPRYVEFRAMLLNDTGACVGPVSLDPLAFAVAYHDGSLIGVVGNPPGQAIAEAAREAEEILAFEDNVEHVASILPDWKYEGATLHLLPEGWRAPECQSPGDVRILDKKIHEYSHIPEELAEELREAEAMRTPIGAAFVDGLPVAFCYAGHVTESLWDVSIDTLEGHRRRGLAMKAAIFMIDYWGRLGRKPVWGSADSNPPSSLLAAKLGFVPVDRLILFTSPQD
jgi:hypothetical protein